MGSKGLTKEIIVQEAVALIEESGQWVISLHELARRLQVKTPSLYNHIANTKDLQREVFRCAIHRFVENQKAAIAGKEKDEAIRAFARAYFAFAAENKGLYRLIMSMPLNNDEAEKEMAVPLLETVMELLAAVLCIPSAAALMILGRGHYRGGLPACYPGLTTLPGYAALPWLVGIYQEYSRDPVVLRFADMILAVVCAVLALYFAASFAFRHPRPRLCLFFSLMGIVLNLEALANGQSLFFTALTAAAVLVLLAQSWALLRTCFGPAWPECLLEDRMPSGALERAEGDNAPGGAGVENHHREDD